MLDLVDLERKKVLPSRRSVFKLNGTIIVAYNTNQPYPQQMNPNPDSPILRHLHLPSYESDNAPYLCAAPASPDYSGVLLGQLKQTATQYPIVQIGDKYTLDPTLADSWVSLEKAMESISFDLVFTAHRFVSLDYLFPPAPSQFGFTRKHDSRHAAVVAVQKSRDAFQILIAHIAWGAILHRSQALHRMAQEKFDKRGSDEGPPDDVWDLSADELNAADDGWKSILESKYKLHPALVHALTQSSICDFSIARAGLVIRKFKDWSYIATIPYLILSNVPIWLVWGDANASISSIAWRNADKNSYGPNSFERRYAHTWSGDPDTGNKHMLPSPPSFPFTINTATTTEDLVTQRPKELSVAAPESMIADTTNRVSEDGSVVTRAITIADKISQRPKVCSVERSDVFEWIRKRKEEIEKAIIKAPPVLRTHYSQRQIIVERHECPGKRGATVYEWDRDEENIPTRKLVSRAEVPQVWSSYGIKQRWFNCLRNEWELCHDMDPDGTPSDTESEYEFDQWFSMNDLSDDSEAQGHQLTIWKDRPIHRDQVDVNASLINSRILSSSDPDSSSTEPSGEGGIEPSLLLSKRFGFAYERGSAYDIVPKRQWSLLKAMGIVGDSKGKRSYDECEGMELPLIQFLMYLCMIGHPDESRIDVPPSLCDLFPENPRYLAQIQSSVRIQIADTGEQQLYLIHHLTDIDREWTLAVTDPCIALMAIRTEPSTVTEFTLELIRTRSPFYTLKRAESIQTPRAEGPFTRHKPRRFGLGERPPGHRLDKSDFIVYEAEKARLLENQRIARASVKRGGILSRLVSGMMDDCEVIAGPSALAMENPFTMTVELDGERVTYFDDSLSDEEISLLVGLYSIKADITSTPAEESWWPTAGKFEDSGLNVGVWTPRCEDWFKRRRIGILEETHRSSTATNWRNLLRFDMDTKRVYKGAKLLAARFIINHF